jgi:hypothetical protein
MIKVEQIDWKKVNKNVTMLENKKNPSQFKKTAYTFVKTENRPAHKKTQLVDKHLISDNVDYEHHLRNIMSESV